MRTLLLAWLASLLLVLPTQAAAPSFDCGKATTAIETLICGNDDLAALDVEVARLFALAEHGKDATSAGKQELIAGERAYLKSREACGTAGDPGTCAADAMVARINDLRQGYADARSQDDKGVSIGPLSADCPGLGAGITVTFVNTPTPRVYLGWGDTTLVLPQGPSGSGARYEGPAPGGTAVFWNKGDNAMLQLPGQPDRECKIEEIG